MTISVRNFAKNIERLREGPKRVKLTFHPNGRADVEVGGCQGRDTDDVKSLLTGVFGENHQHTLTADLAARQGGAPTYWCG
jgi:hypothetical protein